ncbi:MAG: M20/M25/M40 family metallo-hydrolase, partial [Firmicutes bacterium]|nr:M20/M25/M40 family metallo-hydrolase [Bacillota bacterium]
ISKDAYVLDMSGAPGSAANKAPSIISFEAKVHGRSAHAGFAPEEGVNALKAAARAITRQKQGHISEDTTFNVGTIKSGKADNIVANLCVCTGEARGSDHDEAMAQIDNAEKIFREEAEAIGATLEFSHTVHIRAYETPEDAPVCLCFRKACESIGLAGEITTTLGGSDNNVFAEHGLSGIVLSSGMYNTHTVDEYTYVKDLTAGAELVAAIIKNR